MNKGSFFMLSSFLFVRHPFLGPVGSHPPGKRAGSPASLPVCLFPSMPVCRQASIRAGIPTIPPAKENDFRQGCVSLLLRGSIWRCRGSRWRSSGTSISPSFLFQSLPHTLYIIYGKARHLMYLEGWKQRHKSFFRPAGRDFSKKSLPTR